MNHQPTPARSLHPVGSDPHRLGVLDEATCLRLLGTSPVGRLGFSSHGLPVIFPVNYFLHDRTIVFCSEMGEKTRAASHHDVACLEIDQFDAFDHSGWSVLVTGRLSMVDPEHEVLLRRLPLTPWVHGADHFIELPIDLITGRVTESN